MNTPQPNARPVQLTITLTVKAPFNTAAASFATMVAVFRADSFRCSSSAR